MSFFDKVASLLRKDEYYSVESKEKISKNAQNVVARTKLTEGMKSEENEGIDQAIEIAPASSNAIFFKKREGVKLIIFLVENNEDFCNPNSIISKLIKSYNTADYVKFITYGSWANETEILGIETFNTLDLKGILGGAEESSNSCLYDAIIELEKIVSENMFNVIEETERPRKKIESIEIIGIGRCIDNCSKVSKEVSIQAFNKVLKTKGVVTKYICQTEETFANAAEMGFRSIASINKVF